ncbi:MAG TPA: site-specific DNA-methyltransferase [Thermoplasmata archaeon]|nr:site-specific DNA-methyltransferase [Thermoplasmata archaeon]
MASPSPAPFAVIPLSGRRSIVLWNEDSVRGLSRHLPHGSVDVVVTSPPYNLGVPYRSYVDRRPRSEYLAWMGNVRDAVDRVLAPRGSFFLNVGGTPRDPWMPFDLAREVGRTFVLQNVIHWVKSIAIDRDAAGRSAGVAHDLALGHYKPVVSERYLHGAHEYVFHFSRRGEVRLDRLAIGVPYQDKSNVARWQRAGRDLRCRGNTWFLPYPTIRERARDRPHPATFPPELPEWCLRLHGVGRIRRVVDPFVGIGSSAVAAARLGLSFVGFDVDPTYLEVARDRVTRELARPTRS